MRSLSLLGTGTLVLVTMSFLPLSARAQTAPAEPAPPSATGSTAESRASGLRILRSPVERPDVSLADVANRSLELTDATTSASPASYEYQALAIAPLPGRDHTKAYGINNQGQVVGRSHNFDPVGLTDVDRQAFVWDPCCGLRPLPSLSGESGAWGINDDGLASGYSDDALGRGRAVRWDTGISATVLDLGTLTNTTTGVSGDTSTAYDLNLLGQVAGYADIPNDAGDFVPFHAILYDDANELQDLGTFDSSWPQYQFGYSISYDVNSSEQVVGLAHNSAWEFRPFIYDSSGGLRELNQDPSYGPNEWYAVAINDLGRIGGHVIAATDQSLPYYWPDELSDPVPVPMLPAFPYGEIYGMNASGSMVGVMWDDAGVEHGFVFDSVEGVRDLNDLVDPAAGWVLQFARDINDAGQIVGSGEWYGMTRGFVLSPTTGTNLGWITGTVTDAVTGSPLPDVRVAIHDVAGLPLAEAVTDSAGSYTSVFLPAGTYFAATTNDRGYTDELFDDVPCTGCAPTAGLPILVVGGVASAGIDFSLRNPSLPEEALYENGEDGLTDGWVVYDADPVGAGILNVFDATRQSQVIELSGTGTANGYRLRNPDGSPWANTTQRILQWSLAFSESFVVYVDIDTTAGQRFLYYTPVDSDTLGTGRYVHHGVGSNTVDGSWRVLVRDLQADLAEAQPGESILEVNSFLIRGSGRVDDVGLWSAPPVVVYEDAEDGTTNGWVVYDVDPAGASVSNVFDDARRSQVIELLGTDTANGYRLRSDDGSPWSDATHHVIEWSLASSSSFVVYVDVETTAGQRYLYYTPVDSDTLGTGLYVHHGLGSSVADGQWWTFARDLQADLEEAQPGATLLEVNAFLVRGSGRLDNIQLRDRVPRVVYEDGEDQTTKGWVVYDVDPAGASVSNVYDDARRSQVIELLGTDTANGYRLRNDDGSPWSEATHRVLEWSLAYDESFVVYVDVETTAGQRYLYYTPVDFDALGGSQYVHHGVGSSTADGRWRTIVRDLQADLAEAQPGATILEVNAFLVRGSGRLDDVTLSGR